MKGTGTATRARAAAALLAAANVLTIVGLTMMPIGAGRPAPNVVPLRTIAHDWRVGGRHLAINFLGNLLAFLPLGFLAPPALRPRPIRARHVAVAAFALSASIELLQFGLGRRVADVDDVALNTLGALAGYGLFRLLGRAGRGAGVDPRLQSPGGGTSQGEGRAAG